MFTCFFVAHSGCGFPLGNNKRFIDKDTPPKKSILKDNESEESPENSTPNIIMGYTTVPTEATINAREDIDNQYGK